MKYRPHQKRFLKEHPDKALLVWEMRVGKTLPAAVWIDHPSRQGNAYIVSPKANLADWRAMGTKATVLSKEQFAKMDFPEEPTGIVIDEIHYFASPLFLKGKKRSQMATALYLLVKKYPKMPVLGLTATPIRQDSWSLHTLLCYIGIYYDWKDWRERFFEKRYMPFLPRPKWMKSDQVPEAWFPKDDWRIEIREILEKHCDIVSLRDCIADLPEPAKQLIKIKQKPYKEPVGEIVTWVDEHKHEQQNKHKEILALGYKKVIVVVQYRPQIDELKKQLAGEKEIFVLDGRTKDADKVKKAAQEAEECYFIVQASMGFGFDGYMFGAIVFVSMSHSCLHHTQMTGRSRSLEHRNFTTHYYLIGGRWDQRIYDTIQSGEDFNPHKYLHELA